MHLLPVHTVISVDLMMTERLLITLNIGQMELRSFSGLKYDDDCAKSVRNSSDDSSLSG